MPYLFVYLEKTPVYSYNFVKFGSTFFFDNLFSPSNLRLDLTAPIMSIPNH